jgi:chromosome segregation ATPase
VSAKEILALIEQFETAFDTYQQLLKKNSEDIIQNLSTTWKHMKTMQAQNEKLKENIREQNSEITSLRTQAEELDKKLDELKTKKEELSSKITELTTTLESTTNDLKKPQFELETLTTKLDSVNEQINAKESEKTELDQKKVDNESKEADIRKSYANKMDELEKQIKQSKEENFFTAFLIEHSDENYPEVDILATIMEKGSGMLDDLKKQLDVPPIMAVRTIKQMAVKGIINLNEETNEVTLP